jgi:hypothetical protein
MADFPTLGFSQKQNKILLAVGQYVYSFSYLDMATTLALSDRLAGNLEATLITLRGMDFRVKHERLFKVSKGVDQTTPSQEIFDELDQKLKSEYSFRNDIAHSTIGINLDGSAFLNSFGKGFGQAKHVQRKISLTEIQEATQRCWQLFNLMASIFTPSRHQALLATLVDEKDPEPLPDQPQRNPPATPDTP